MTSAAQLATPCTACRMSLDDACQPFALNDSAAAAYEAAMARVLGISPEGTSPYASNFRRPGS